MGHLTLDQMSLFCSWMRVHGKGPIAGNGPPFTTIVVSPRVDLYVPAAYHRILPERLPVPYDHGDHFALPCLVPARRGRDGGGLRSRRPKSGASCSAQIPAAGVGERSGSAGALAARSTGGLGPESSEHLYRLRDWAVRRALFHCHGVAGGRNPQAPH